MKNLNSTTRPTSPCWCRWHIEIGLFYFWVGMFTPVIIAVSTIPAIIPHSNYFNNRDFVKGIWDGAKSRTYSVIAEEYFHCCHVIIRRLNTRLQRKSITPESYRIKRVITQFKNSIILIQFHSVVYIVDRICVRPRKPFQSQLSNCHCISEYEVRLVVHVWIFDNFICTLNKPHYLKDNSGISLNLQAFYRKHLFPNLHFYHFGGKTERNEVSERKH